MSLTIVSMQVPPCVSCLRYVPALKTDCAEFRLRGETPRRSETKPRRALPRARLRPVACGVHWPTFEQRYA